MDLMYRNASRLDARDYASGYLYLALNIGEQMLMCGAEVHRVEDCIRRICTAYGAVRVDVFSITSSIVVTMYGPDFGSLTQTRRISRQNTDMYRLDRLNQLSRDICSAVPPLSEAADELKAIKNSPRYSAGVRLILYAVVSASFTVFFGGNWQDAVVSGILGMILMFLERLLESYDVNPFLSAFLFSLLGGFGAIFAVEHGLADSMDKISIGNIMLRFPGIMLTNSIRDFFNGDTMTGILRFLEAAFLSMTIAFGFVVAAAIWQ